MAVTNEDMNKDKNNVSTETTKKINMAEIYSYGCIGVYVGRFSD